MNPVLNQIAAHASVRKFERTPLADATIESAVVAAQQAATSSHVQAYCLLQVTDEGKRERLAELTGGQPQVAEAGAFFAVCGDQRRHKLIAERANVPRCANLESFLVATVDASLFAQNLVLAFESLGLGTCYIGGLRTKSSEVDALLDIPQDVFPLYGLCVGVPEEAAKPRARLAAKAVWFKDAYPSDEEMLELIDAHDAEMAREYEARGLSGRNWSGGVSRKFAKPLREHLLDYYTSKGARFE